MDHFKHFHLNWKSAAFILKFSHGEKKIDKKEEVVSAMRTHIKYAKGMLLFL